MKQNKKLGNKFNFDFVKEQKAWKKASRNGNYSEWIASFMEEHSDIFASQIERSDFCHFMKSHKKGVLVDATCNSTVLYPLLIGFTMASLSWKYSDMTVQMQNYCCIIGFVVMSAVCSIAIINTIYNNSFRNEFIEDVLSIFLDDGDKETK